MFRKLLVFLICSAALEAADFPKPFNTGNDVGKMPMPAAEAVKLIKLPPGFKATVFAAEPDVQNPIACAWDSRGRLWIAENYTYAEGKTNYDRTLRDRILIFEDTDNDGHFDKRTVFADNLEKLTSIELGYGGVYATAPPYLLRIPDRNGDDRPDPMDAMDKMDAAKKSIASSESIQSIPATPFKKKLLPGTNYEILLDGFDAWSIRHNFVNGLRWGPDGWLYGRHGIQATSHIGAPGTPAAERTAMNCGIWRFHPVRRSFEVVCWGGTNPWGLDWNAEGEGFFTNTVIGHVYHLIPGAHYERMYGEDLNPHIYQLLPQSADHYHYDRSKTWSDSRAGKANDFGGGHAHCGCMIYQGDNWPAEYRGKLFTLNLHGRRMNCERLERKGSTYVAKHEPDFAQFGDPWFRGIDLTTGPDGGVYVLDWSDDGECHEEDGVHRESGRIYKITYGEVKKPALGEKGDLAAMTDEQLVSLAIEGSVWHSRVALRLLAERTAATNIAARSPEGLGKLAGGETTGSANKTQSAPAGAQERNADATKSSAPSGARPNADGDPVVSPPANLHQRSGLLARLRETLAKATNTPQRLRALWALHAMGGFDGGLSDFATGGPDEYTLAWGIRLAADTRRSFPSELLKKNPVPNLTPFVLRAYAGAAQSRTSLNQEVSAAYDCWLPPNVRPSSCGAYKIQQIIPNVPADADETLALVVWSGMTAVEKDSPGFIGRASQGVQSPILLRWVSRFLASGLANIEEEKLIPLDVLMAEFAKDAARQHSIVLGVSDALRGVRKSPRPRAWPDFSAKAVAANPALADKVRELNVIFGDGRALDEIRTLALDGKADLATRRQAIESLISSGDSGLRGICKKLAGNGDLTPVAIRGLATFDDPAAATLAVRNWNRVRADARPGVIGSLCTRPVFAQALLTAIRAGKIARENLTAYHARQIAALGDAEVSALLAEVWGEIRTTPDDKKRRIAALKIALTPDVLAKADIAKGRALYTQTCAACHTLFDLGQSGANLGPNLTGSGRANLDYLLENIMDPSAVVPADYKLSTVTLKDGRVLSGFISAKNEQTFTLRTMTENQTLPASDVTKTEASPLSLMPDGLLDALTPEQVRDLFGFLIHK